MSKFLCFNRVVGWVAAVALFWCAEGCSDSTSSSSRGSRSAPTVYLDPAMNGAARGDSTRAHGAALATSERKLSFVALGTGRRPATGSEQERKLAMSQAAIIDALGGAVAESRRLSGLSVDDFSCDLGPRVSIIRRGGEAGEIELRLAGSGGVRMLKTRGGVLQQKPVDLATIQRVMDATGGQYALLSVEQSAIGDECVASVARYEMGATVVAAGASDGRAP